MDFCIKASWNCKNCRTSLDFKNVEINKVVRDNLYYVHRCHVCSTKTVFVFSAINFDNVESK